MDESINHSRWSLRPRKSMGSSVHESEKAESTSSSDETKKFVCETCGAKFEFKRNFARHKQYHSKTREVGRCYFCNTKFISLQQLHEHLSTCSGRLQPLQAPSKQNQASRNEIKPDEIKQYDSKHLKITDDETQRIPEAAVSNDDFDDLDFVLNENGDIEATQRTLEEMRQREIKFVENLWELLTLLLDGKNKSRILDSQKPVAQILEAVIIQCGHDPIRATGTYTSRLRENCKLLFKIAVGPSVEKLIATKPIEVVLEEVIKRGKESLKLSQEIIVIDSDSDS